MDSDPSTSEHDGLRRSKRPKAVIQRFAPESPDSPEKPTKKKKKTQEDPDSSFNLSSAAASEASSSSSSFSSLVDESDESFVLPSGRAGKKSKARPWNSLHIPLGGYLWLCPLSV